MVDLEKECLKMGTVEVDVQYLERLTRDSERLEVVIDYVTKCEYMSNDTLKILLGIKEKGCEE